MNVRYRLSRLPYWLLAAILLAVIFAFHIFEDADYTLIFKALSQGIKTTLFVSFTAYLIAILLGMLIALAGFSKSRVIREFATFYVEIIRGVPILVLLFYIAFVGAPQLVALYNWILTPLIDAGFMEKARVRDFDLMWRAIFALSISYSAFIAEIFRAGIKSVDIGQIEAARALGLSRWNTFRLITFPQAFRTILPPLANDFVAIIKDSALVSALGVQDVTQLGKLYSSSTFKFFETYNVVAYLYLMLTVSLSLVIRFFEKRLNRHNEHN